MNKEKVHKVTRNQYFMEIAFVSSKRSTCFSEAKGAVIVKNNRVISTGYNGAPSGIKSCKYEDGICRKRSLGYGHGEGHSECKAVHAEVNAILNAAMNGISTKETVLYCTHKPCEQCAKIIINSGIKTIYYFNEYKSKFADELLSKANIECIKLFYPRGDNGGGLD